MWLLTVRLRALSAPLGKIYVQELVNHAFIDTEHRIRAPPHKITKNTLVKGYMKTMLHQHYGAHIGFDWALAEDSDPLLAAAIWRNVFGAEWGGGMGGVKGVFGSEGDSNDGSKKPMEDRWETDTQFANQLERIIKFVRSELVRMSQIEDEEVIRGQGLSNRLIQFSKL